MTKQKVSIKKIDLKNWPILYKDILVKGNLESSLAICSLWTEREVVKDLIKDKSKYAVIGNLYSGQGVNAIIRNVMANPRIRTIVLWGAELSLSGHALKLFVEKGVDEERRIIGGRGEIEEEITDETINLFRKNVEIIDMRGKKPAELLNFLNKYKNKKAFADKAMFFSESRPIIRPMPSEQIGFRVEGKTVAQTWLKLLNEIYKYGRYKHTRYTQQNELREVLNMVAVVTSENPEDEYFPSYLPFSREELTAYYPELLTDRQIPGTAYNYGFRLRKHFGVNQIEKMKELIKSRPDSKKMLAITTDAALDWSNANNGDTPCLVMILGSVVDEKFYMTAHFRSHDMVHGWPRNAFGLRKVQKEIADAGGYSLGKLCIISHSAHIYSDDFKLVENILSDNFEKELGFTPAVHFSFDQRGNVIVNVQREDPLQSDFSKKSRPAQDDRKKNNGEIVVQLFEPDGGPLIKEWRDKKASTLIWKVCDWNYITDPSHAMYVGTELQRAEYCLKNGLEYSQDPAPNKMDIKSSK